MEVLYLAIIFAVIVVIVWMKKPLYLAMVAGIVASILLFRINPLEALTVLAKQTASWETIDLLLSFYVIIFLQLMLEKKGRLANAKDAFNRLFRNRRINTMIPPAIMGLLDAKSKTFVSCYYRHIPEMFLPTFPVILLAMSLSGQNVGTFILTMIPLVILACLVVNFTYLRKIPKDMPPLDDTVDKKQEVLRLLRNLWTLILVLVIIVAGNLSASFAGPIVIAINYFVDHFKAKDLPEMLVKSAEPVLLGNMYLIMLFKSLLSHTGVLGKLPEFFSQFPISMTLSFFLLFFFGTVISGSQAIVALCMPMVMAAFPDAGMPLLVMLMGVAWAAMEISPTHVCAFVAADYYHTTFADIFVKALPSVLIFSVICYGYGELLMLVF